MLEEESEHADGDGRGSRRAAVSVGATVLDVCGDLQTRDRDVLDLSVHRSGSDR